MILGIDFISENKIVVTGGQNADIAIHTEDSSEPSEDSSLVGSTKERYER